MTHLHNIILRVLNSIYQQAPHVKETKDIKDFLQYIKAWHDILEQHHETEEKVFFPELEKLTGIPGCMDGNIEQHHAFEPGLVKIGKYATETLPETYDGAEARSIIDSFGSILQQHLNEEIETLKELKQYNSAELKKIWHKSGDYAKKCGEIVS
jgi:hemerythrin-like domain-containing protein